MTARPERSTLLLAVHHATGISLRLIKIDGLGSFTDIDTELHYRHLIKRYEAVSVGRSV